MDETHFHLWFLYMIVGLCLVHVFFLMALDRLDITVLPITPVLAVPALTAVVFIWWPG